MNKYFLIILGFCLYSTSFSMDNGEANHLQQKYPRPINWHNFEQENLDEYTQDEVTPFLCAAISQKAPVKVVTSILDGKELSSNTRDEHDNPLLTIAILSHNTEAAAALVRRKAKVVYEMDKYSGSRNGDEPVVNITPWQAACIVGQEKYARLLYSKMSENTQRAIIRTRMTRLDRKLPLDYALIHRKTEFAQFLCSVDEFIVTADYDHARATNVAGWHDATYLKLLFEKMGRIVETDINRLLTVAIDKENLEGVTFLISKGATINDQMCALAAFRKNKALLDILCATGVKLSTPDSLPLRHCLTSLHIDTTVPITLLLEAGASASEHPENSLTQPIHLIANKYFDISLKQAFVKIFRSAGVKLDTQDIQGRTLLHLVCNSELDGEDDEFMFYLLDLGANSDTVDNEGKTPFLLFCKSNRNPNKLSKFLDTYAPDVNVQDKDGNTPLIHAAAQGKKSFALIAHLQNYHANMTASRNEMLFAACRTLNVELAHSLINNYGANVNYMNKKCKTVLMEVISAHNFARKGWNSSREKITRAKLALIALLVKNGANVNSQDAEGYTALHQTVEKEHLPDSILEILLANGADASTRNAKGQTPLEISICGISAFSQSKKKTEMLLAHTKENPIILSTGQTLVEYLLSTKRSSSFDTGDWQMKLLDLFTAHNSKSSADKSAV